MGAGQGDDRKEQEIEEVEHNRGREGEKECWDEEGDREVDGRDG